MHRGQHLHSRPRAHTNRWAAAVQRPAVPRTMRSPSRLARTSNALNSRRAGALRRRLLARSCHTRRTAHTPSRRGPPTTVSALHRKGGIPGGRLPTGPGPPARLCCTGVERLRAAAARLATGLGPTATPQCCPHADSSGAQHGTQSDRARLYVVCGLVTNRGNVKHSHWCTTRATGAGGVRAAAVRGAAPATSGGPCHQA